MIQAMEKETQRKVGHSFMCSIEVNIEENDEKSFLAQMSLVTVYKRVSIEWGGGRVEATVVFSSGKDISVQKGKDDSLRQYEIWSKVLFR